MQGQHGVAGQPLAHDERGGRQQAQASPGKNERVRPATPSGLVEDSDEEGDRRNDRALRWPVHGAIGAAGRGGYLAQRQQQASASNGQVDEKDPAPAHSRDQKTAQKGTGGGSDACHGAPQAKGARALSG